jgi:CheY-like chemotaxis protein
MERSAPAQALIIEDDLNFVRVVRNLLEHADPPLAVHAVESGAEALAFLERQPPFADALRPTFIVLDFHLPDMNAAQILQCMRDNQSLSAIPVLVVSGIAEETNEQAAMAAGATAFKVKPSRLCDLQRILDDFVGGLP